MYTNSKSNYNKSTKATPKTAQRESRWSDVSGAMKVFSNERNGYRYFSTTVGNRQEDGSYQNMYYDVRFPRGAELPPAEMFDIMVLNGFISFRKWEDRKGNTHQTPVIIVMEFEYR